MRRLHAFIIPSRLSSFSNCKVVAAGDLRRSSAKLERQSLKSRGPILPPGTWFTTPTQPTRGWRSASMTPIPIASRRSCRQQAAAQRLLCLSQQQHFGSFQLPAAAEHGERLPARLRRRETLPWLPRCASRRPFQGHAGPLQPPLKPAALSSASQRGYAQFFFFGAEIQPKHLVF